jgi:hypothetical protein
MWLAMLPRRIVVFVLIPGSSSTCNRQQTAVLTITALQNSSNIKRYNRVKGHLSQENHTDL